MKILIQENIVKKNNILFWKITRVGNLSWTKLILYWLMRIQKWVP